MIRITKGREHWLLAFGMVLAVSCSTIPKASDPSLQITQAGVFSLRFVTSRALELEPCGCSMRPLGGIDREWNWLHSSKSTAPAAFNFTSGLTFIPNPYQEDLKTYASSKADFMLEALNQLNTHGISPAAADFTLGMKRIKELQAHSHFPWISANLVDSTTHALLFERFHQYGDKTLPIFVTGISHSAPRISEVATLPPEQAMQEVVQRLPAGPKLLIVLSTLSPADRDHLLALFPQINFMVGDNEEAGSHDLEIKGPNSYIVNPASRGRGIAVVDLKLLPTPGGSPAFLPLYADESAAVIANQRTQDQRDLTRVEELLKENKIKRKEKANLLKTRQELSTRLAKTAEIAVTPPSTGSVINYSVVDLDSEFAVPRNSLTELIERFKKTVHDEAVNEGTEHSANP